MLHPRVLQVLSPDVVDSTLNRVVTLCDESIDYAAYQYPDYFIESREGRRKPVLTPEEFSMDFLDAIRDLRANDVVTWTRRRKPSAERIAAVEETVERMEQRGNSVEGVVWLLIAEEESSLEHPVVVIKDRGEITGRRSVEELIHLCETVKTRFRALFTIEPTSEYISSRV